jgi:hypothetical protein
MHHINTSPEALSKLKKAAKLLARGDTLIQHAEALDRVAKEAGYLHWKHVTTCAETTSAAKSTSSPLAKVTAAECADPRFGKIQDQELILVVGPSGSGKSLRAIDYALNALRQGKPVHVLDIGRSYWHLCRTVGGTYSTFALDGSRTDERHGDTPLIVFDLENLVAPRTSVPVHEIAPNALLVVDEIWHMPRVLGAPDALKHLVEAHLATGGSTVLLDMVPMLPNGPKPSLDIKSRSSVRRSLVQLDRI